VRLSNIALHNLVLGATPLRDMLLRARARQSRQQSACRSDAHKSTTKPG
jgi:hypothetical protein